MSFPEGKTGSIDFLEAVGEIVGGDFHSRISSEALMR